MNVCFGSKVKPRTSGCVLPMGSAQLFILISRLLIYFAGSGVNRILWVRRCHLGECQF